MRRSRHHGDIAHASVPAYRSVEQGCADSAGQDSALECASPPVRNIQDQLIEKLLHRKPRRREDELFVLVEKLVYPRVDGRASGTDAEVWVQAHRVGRKCMTAFVSEDASRETVAHQLQVPAMTGARRIFRSGHRAR